MAAISDDLPALGNPTRPASATVLSSSTRVSSAPGSPRKAKPGALRLGVANAALPSPPRPPRAATNLVPAPTRSASSSPSSVLTAVRAGALLAAGRPAQRAAVQVQQRGHAGIHLEDHVAAAASVAAVRPAQWLELLPVHRRATVPAIASLHPQRDVVGELGHLKQPPW